MSNLVNKVKDAVGGNTHHTNTTAGPHSSDTANKADPRVDSDRSQALGGHGTTGAGLTGTHAGHSTTGGGLAGTHAGHSTTGGGLTGTHAGHSTTGGGLTGSHGTTHGNTTAGPHSSDMMNKADPRVDSDRSQGLGGHGTTGSGLTGTHGTTGSGLTGSHAHGTTGSGLTGSHGTTHGNTTAGPHSSDMANKADPRVDSDRSQALGGTGVGHSTGHTTTGHTTTGHHGTTGGGLAGSHGTHGNTSGLTGAGAHPGPAPNTAGPHKSDMLNKLDPRVDSDLDGSKTVGGDKTFSSNTPDTHDAAQVPPSQFQKPHGHHTATQGSRQGSI